MMTFPIIQYSKRRRVVLSTVLMVAIQLTNAFVIHSARPTFRQAACHAKRKKNQRDDDFSSWYDNVDENASPDDVFWEEMERQRRLTTTEPLLS